MIVMKFGGSSLESAAAVEKVADIIGLQEHAEIVVVVSAMGKTTDRLLEIAETAVEGRTAEARRLSQELRDYLVGEAKQLAPADAVGELEDFLGSHFRELAELVDGLAGLGELTPRAIDAVSSYGERMTSLVIAQALRRRGFDAAHLDARRIMVTDDRHTQAAPILELTNERLRETILPLLAEGKLVVMGGFIGSTEDGVTSTLGRGGSDFTASIVGAGLGAEEIQIWTDVDGVLTADPSILPGARRLRVMSFDEASELAYFGARVLHPSTMAPAVESNIPLRVLNSRKPEQDGTLIVAECPSSTATVKSIAYKESITVVDIYSTRMLMAHGFLAKIFEIFDRHQTAVDMVATTEVSVSLTIDRTDRLVAITAELEKFAEVNHTSGQVIMCVVGEDIRYTPGISGKIFKAVEGIGVRMISQGASRLNISFVIDEADLQAAVEALHQTFFAEIDKTVFA